MAKKDTAKQVNVVDQIVIAALQIIDANDSALKEWMEPVVAMFGDACLPTAQGGLDGRGMKSKDKETRENAANMAGLTLAEAEQLTEIKRRIAERRANFFQDCQIAYYGKERIKGAASAKAVESGDMLAAKEAKKEAIEQHNAAKLAAMETSLELAKAKIAGDKEAQEKLKVKKTRYEADSKYYKEQAAEHEAAYQAAKTAAQSDDAWATLTEKLETLCKAFENNADTETASLAKRVLAML